MNKKIKCPICHRSFKQLQSHVRKHGTLKEFKRQFPDVPLISESQTESIRVRMNNGQAASMGKRAKGCRKPNSSILMQGNKRGANTDRSGEKERYRNQALKQHAENNFGIWDDERRSRQSQITKERWASGNLHCVWRPKWHSDLEKLLLDNNINFESEYSIKKSFEGKRLYKPYDVYIPDFNLLIELQGCFWHGCIDCCINYHPRQEKVKKNDLEKKEFAEKCGYKIVQIWEHDKQKIHCILVDLGILKLKD